MVNKRPYIRAAGCQKASAKARRQAAAGLIRIGIGKEPSPLAENGPLREDR